MTTSSGPGSWDAAERLAARFPTVRREEIVAVLIDARRAVDLFGLPIGEEIEMAERLATEQLMQISGESVAAARLDPETHASRKRTDGEDAVADPIG